MHKSIWKCQYLPSNGQASVQRALLVLFVGTLGAESNISEIIVTDTLPVPANKMIPNLKVVSVSDMLGEAISRIHAGLSVGAMFGH